MGETVMLCTYDRYMREFRLKRTAAKYAREDAGRNEQEVVPSVHVALLAARAAVKATMRHMEGHA